jgi:hypothetical protein
MCQINLSMPVAGSNAVDAVKQIQLRGAVHPHDCLIVRATAVCLWLVSRATERLNGNNYFSGYSFEVPHLQA